MVSYGTGIQWKMFPVHIPSILHCVLLTVGSIHMKVMHACLWNRLLVLHWSDTSYCEALPICASRQLELLHLPNSLTTELKSPMHRGHIQSCLHWQINLVNWPVLFIITCLFSSNSLGLVIYWLLPWEMALCISVGFWRKIWAWTWNECVSDSWRPSCSY
jgi:hypothetical protein